MFSILGGALSGGLVIWLWLSLERFHTKALPALRLPVGDYTPDLVTRVQCLALALLPLGFLLSVFVVLHRLFYAYGKAEIFTARNARRIRYIAFVMAALAVMRPFYMWACAHLIAPEAAPGLFVYLGLRDALVLFFALIFYVIAHVLAEAARIREENDQFI